MFCMGRRGRTRIYLHGVLLHTIDQHARGGIEGACRCLGLPPVQVQERRGKGGRAGGMPHEESRYFVFIVYVQEEKIGSGAFLLACIVVELESV